MLGDLIDSFMMNLMMEWEDIQAITFNENVHKRDTVYI